MPYGLPAIGEENWGQKVNDSIQATKDIADANTTNIATATSTANTAISDAAAAVTEAAAATAALANKSDIDHNHTSADIVDVDFSTFTATNNGFYAVKWNSGTSTYPNRSSSGTVDPNLVVWWIGGPGPTKSGTGSTGAVTGDFYVATP